MEFNKLLLNTCARVLVLCVLALHADDDAGGWALDSASRFQDEGPCNIDVVDASQLSHKDFIYRYAYSRPVIIRGLTDNTKFRSLCSKSSLLEEYGNFRVRLSTANTYSYQKVDVPFSEYVDDFLKPQSAEALGSETLYFFGDNNFTEWRSLFAQYRSPPYVLPRTTGAYSFGIAGSGTGVPFHWHGPGYSEVVYGRKRWFLYPPDQTPHFHPNRTTLSWVTETYPVLPQEEAPLECTIRPGESTSEQTLGGEGETHRDVGCQSDSYTVSSATQTARHVRTVGTTMLLPPPRSVSTQLSLDTLAPHVRSKGSQATASRQNVGTQTVVPGKGLEFPPVKSLDSALRSIAAKRRARLEELESDEEPEDSVVSEPRDSTHLPGESLTRPSGMSGTDSTEDEEPQFIVFESCLTELLRTCPVCQRDCAVKRTGLGTHVAFTQLCPNCQFSRRKLLRL